MSESSFASHCDIRLSVGSFRLTGRTHDSSESLVPPRGRASLPNASTLVPGWTCHWHACYLRHAGRLGDRAHASTQVRLDRTARVSSGLARSGVPHRAVGSLWPVVWQIVRQLSRRGNRGGDRGAVTPRWLQDRAQQIPHPQSPQITHK